MIIDQQYLCFLPDLKIPDPLRSGCGKKNGCFAPLALVVALGPAGVRAGRRGQVASFPQAGAR